MMKTTKFLNSNISLLEAKNLLSRKKKIVEERHFSSLKNK